METRILEIDDGALALAADIIRGGCQVAFPTETVYGLGANAFDSAAVDSIFRIKGRPNDNPLIVHVHKDYDLSRLVRDVPDYAVKLAKAYLPGPLTMVYKSLGVVSPAVSCGLDTLAVRIPSHEGAQRFLRYLDLPVAAPSANISKHVSPTSAEHVYADLQGRIPLILDGGRCAGGIESTVLDCTGDTPTILREGLITREMIAAVAGSCSVYTLKEGEAARSPGMKYRHYTPDCGAVLYAKENLFGALERYDGELSRGGNPVIMCDNVTAEKTGDRSCLNLGSSPAEIAASLYAALREGERKFGFIIAVEPVFEGGEMDGVMNRLTKACGSKI